MKNVHQYKGDEYTGYLFTSILGVLNVTEAIDGRHNGIVLINPVYICLQRQSYPDYGVSKIQLFH